MKKYLLILIIWVFYSCTGENEKFIFTWVIKNEQSNYGYFITFENNKKCYLPPPKDSTFTYTLGEWSLTETGLLLIESKNKNFNGEFEYTFNNPNDLRLKSINDSIKLILNRPN